MMRAAGLCLLLGALLCGALGVQAGYRPPSKDYEFAGLEKWLYDHGAKARSQGGAEAERVLLLTLAAAICWLHLPRCALTSVMDAADRPLAAC